MKAGKIHSFEREEQSSFTERKTGSRRRKTIAALTTFACVGIGGFAQSDRPASGLASIAPVSYDSSNLPPLPATPVNTENASQVYQYEEMRGASDHLQNDEVVKAVVDRVAEVIAYEEVVRSDGDPSRTVVGQTINNYHNNTTTPEVCIAQEGEVMTPDVEVNAALYRGGTGVLSIRLGSSACRNGSVVSQEAVTLTLEVQHDGRETYDIREAVYELSNDPSSAKVSSIGADRNDESVYVTSTLSGTGLKGEKFYTLDATGDLVRPSSHAEAEQIAAKANQLALEVARTV